MTKKMDKKEYVFKNYSYIFSDGETQVIFKKYIGDGHKITNRTATFYSKSTDKQNGLVRFEQTCGTLEHITNENFEKFTSIYFNNISDYLDAVKAWADFSQQDYRKLI